MFRDATIRIASSAAWKAFQLLNRAVPEGKAIHPKWAPAPLLKSHEKSRPPLGFPRTTDSLCPKCVKEVRTAILAEIGVRRAPVNDYVRAVDDADVVANGYVAEVEHPAGGTTRVVGSPIAMSETPLTPAAMAPELGQHTEEILLDVGYDWDDIAALRESGAI